MMYTVTCMAQKNPFSMEPLPSAPQVRPQPSRFGSEPAPVLHGTGIVQVSDRNVNGSGTEADYLKSGSREGTRGVVGRHRIGEKDYFVEPTVITNTRRNIKIEQEEIS
jgi:hypothetical protein